jgi:beta-glucosidase
MEFGNALADVLLGAVEPGGRLPTTWPTAISAAPVIEVTPTDGRLDYTEGLDIGHCAYLRAGTEPAYWFGHGLGYTTWEYESIEAATAEDGLSARLRVRNTGDRRGRQVVQVYAARPDSAVERPARRLAGFAVVTAEPGETVEVPVAVSARTLRHWDTDACAWAVEPGDVVLSTGPHAGDLRASATVELGRA